MRAVAVAVMALVVVFLWLEVMLVLERLTILVVGMMSVVWVVSQ